MKAIQFKILLLSTSLIGWSIILFLYSYSYEILRIDELGYGIFAVSLLVINFGTLALLDDGSNVSNVEKITQSSVVPKNMTQEEKP